MKAASAPASARLESNFKRFLHEEDGALALFMIVMFVLMLTFGGMAVDLMRFENRRVAVQQTMDRAALAAASLTQTQDAKLLVDDFFEKAKITSGAMRPTEMVEIGAAVTTIKKGDNNEFRKVNVRADVRSYNYFMDMFFMPVEYLESPNFSQAEQGSSSVEVILVLDVSGSMRHQGKIAALKAAATNFVESVKGPDTLNQVSIGIVPYQGQVNLGQSLREKYNGTLLPALDGVVATAISDVNCLELPRGVFNATALSRTAPFPVSALADTSSGAATRVPVNDPINRFCNPTTVNTVMLPTKDAATAKAKIAGLKEAGYTSIMLGMRWGAALIDESANPIYKDLLPANMHDRPAAKRNVETRKIIVLMTDGLHQSVAHVVDEFKTGPSPIYKAELTTSVKRETKRSDGTWRNDGTTTSKQNYYTINFPDKPKRPTVSGDNAFYNSFGTGSWQATAKMAGSGPTVTNPSTTTRRTTTVTSSDPVKLDWSAVWADLTVAWVSKELYADSAVIGAGQAEMMNAFLDAFLGDPSSPTFSLKADGSPSVDIAVHNTYKDKMLKETCDKAKGSNVEIFGIALTAPVEGQAAIKSCVSIVPDRVEDTDADDTNDSHYFFIPADQTNEQIATQLNTAFQQIASVISPLRLTQ
jgi:Flp pilus assembly protein TadG